jgi:hypothetical protein
VTRPLRGARQAGQDADQRGLAGAVGAEQAEELAGLDVEADTPSSARTVPRAPLKVLATLEGNGDGGQRA